MLTNNKKYKLFIADIVNVIINLLADKEITNHKDHKNIQYTIYKTNTLK